ncbi:hypothetical protein EYF80_019563 [Liparis tanakae]|uniref:Uncharacterized protein n=1 Tax=Liparis tanakae TaxID=230148 RepID=A0A4Z2HZ16_9TELE|nr:hypothetical protein EYF80_019563 [Liparis tanakae]
MCGHQGVMKGHVRPPGSYEGPCAATWELRRVMCSHQGARKGHVRPPGSYEGPCVATREL